MGQLPSQPFEELLCFVFLLPPKLFGPEKLWRRHPPPADSEYALEPHTAPSSHNLKPSQLRPQPSFISSVAWAIHIPSLSTELYKLKPTLLSNHPCLWTLRSSVYRSASCSASVTALQFQPLCICSGRPSILPQTIRADFHSLLREYNSVFGPPFLENNGAAGPYKAKVNLGSVKHPQRKGHLPQYARDKLIKLQEKFDHLAIQPAIYCRPVCSVGRAPVC